MRFVERIKYRVNYVDIMTLVSRSDVVGIPWRSVVENIQNGLTVIVDKDPVANIHTVSVNGYRLIGQCVSDHQRDKFFRELAGPVIISAPRDHRVEFKSMAGGSQEMLGSCLRRRIRRIWPER